MKRKVVIGLTIYSVIFLLAGLYIIRTIRTATTNLDRLKDVLLTMHLDPEGKQLLERFGALKFIETTNKDYDVVREYAEHVHLDLATYEYLNN